MEFYKTKSDVYFIIGNYKEAYKNHLLFTNRRDSLRNEANISYLTELETQYNVDTLKYENEVAALQRKNLWITIISVTLICVLLIMLLIFLFRNNKRLRERNLELVKRIKEQHKTEDEIDTLRKSIPTDELTKEEILYSEMQTLLWDKKLFTDPDFNRDSLASLLNTNRTYILDAFHYCN